MHGHQLAVCPHKGEFLQVAGWVVGKLYAGITILTQVRLTVESEIGYLRRIPQGIIRIGTSGVKVRDIVYDRPSSILP